MRELVLEEQERTTPNLPHDDVKLAVVAEVGSGNCSAVASGVGAGNVTHVGKPHTLEVHKRPVPLVGTEVVPFLDDVPRVAHPELFVIGIELARLGNLGTAFEWL